MMASALHRQFTCPWQRDGCKPAKCWNAASFSLGVCIAGMCALQVVEEGYEFFAKRQLVTIFSAPNYCGEFENAGAMMSVDETLMCSFQVRVRV